MIKRWKAWPQIARNFNFLAPIRCGKKIKNKSQAKTKKLWIKMKVGNMLDLAFVVWCLHPRQQAEAAKQNQPALTNQSGLH